MSIQDREPQSSADTGETEHKDMDSLDVVEIQIAWGIRYELQKRRGVFDPTLYPPAFPHDER